MNAERTLSLILDFKELMRKLGGFVNSQKINCDGHMIEATHTLTNTANAVPIRLCDRELTVAWAAWGQGVQPVVSSK
jgi:hypothetical protein